MIMKTIFELLLKIFFKDIYPSLLIFVYISEVNFSICNMLEKLFEYKINKLVKWIRQYFHSKHTIF